MDALTFAKNYGLSRREMEVAVQVGRGLTNKEVGQELYITEKSVKFHLTNIYRKTDLKSRMTLSLLLVSQGVVEIRPSLQLEPAPVVKSTALPRSSVSHLLPRGA